MNLKTMMTKIYEIKPGSDQHWMPNDEASVTTAMNTTDVAVN